MLFQIWIITWEENKVWQWYALVDANLRTDEKFIEFLLAVVLAEDDKSLMEKSCLFLYLLDCSWQMSQLFGKIDLFWDFSTHILPPSKSIISEFPLKVLFSILSRELNFPFQQTQSLKFPLNFAANHFLTFRKLLKTTPTDLFDNEQLSYVRRFFPPHDACDIFFLEDISAAHENFAVVRIVCNSITIFYVIGMKR